MKNSTITFEQTVSEEAPRDAEPRKTPQGKLGRPNWNRLTLWVAEGERRLARWALPEVAFFRLGLVFGLLFLVITPPAQVSDEPVHFYRACYLANGKLRAVRLGDTGVGAELPRSISATMDQVKGEIAHNSTEKQSV